MDLIFSCSVYSTNMDVPLHLQWEVFLQKLSLRCGLKEPHHFVFLPFQKNVIFRIFLREEKRRHEALTPALESLDQKWRKSFSGTSLSCDPINLQEACKCSPRCLEEADNHRWVNNTLLTIIQWNSVIERCKRAHQKEAIYKSGKPLLLISGTSSE